MHASTLFSLAVAFTAAQAGIIPRSLVVTSDQEDPNFYASDVCVSLNNTSPCFNSFIIEWSCQYGAASGLNISQSLQESAWNVLGLINPPPELPLVQQRNCLCESNFFDEYTGCSSCFEKHGVQNFGPGAPPPATALTSWSSSYCQVTNTPTLGVQSAITAAFSTFPGVAPSNLNFFSTTTTVTWTDPIGNKTDVSAYYTPAVTGVAAISVNQPGPGTTVTATSLKTNSAGQIFATKSAQSGGIATAVADKFAMAGAIGFAAAAILL